MRIKRQNDPEGVRRNILEVATVEFAQRGFSGARVDAIADRTRTSKRMIYYYFGSKERLYLAVLEAAYSAIRRQEATLDLEHQPPEQALVTLVASTFDYYHAHPEFVRLVMNENIMDGVHMKRSKAIGKVKRSPRRRSDSRKRTGVLPLPPRQVRSNNSPNFERPSSKVRNM